jgi:hypothetical protein
MTGEAISKPIRKSRPAFADGEKADHAVGEIRPSTLVLQSEDADRTTEW